QNYSGRWQMAINALQNGQTTLGLSELKKLYDLRNKLNSHLRGDVIYSYAVALSIAGFPDKAVVILKKFRKAKGERSPRYDPTSVAVELSGAYLVMGQYELARTEANLALELAAKRNISPLIAYINKGIAERELANLDDADSNFLTALKIACKQNDFLNAAIAAEHLSRTALLQKKKTEAYAWAERAEKIYQRVAPQHLPTTKILKQTIIERLENIPISLGLPKGVQLIDKLIILTEGTPQHSRLDVLDIDLYQFLFGVMKKEKKFWVVIPLEMGSIKPANLAPTLISEIETISDHECYPSFVQDTFLARHFGIQANEYPSVDLLKTSICHTSVPGSNLFPFTSLIWEGMGPWPWGFNPVLRLLSSLYIAALGNMISDLEKLAEVGIPDMTFLSLTARTWPRPIHARYIGLGEFESGKVPTPQHVLEDITRIVRNDNKFNNAAFHTMGYTEDEASDMTQGGLIAIPFSEYPSLVSGISDWESWWDIFGGIPVEEYNSVNLPRSLLYSIPKKDLREGLFVDSYYQTPFWARTPGDYALYGEKNDQFRDHYDDFRKKLNIMGTIRTKHYAVPIVEVEDFAELRVLSNKILEYPNTGIFFRGQTKGYTLKRTSIVKRLLFGRENVVEPSLLGSAPRRRLDYNRVHSALQLHVQDFIYQQAVNSGNDLEPIHNEWLKLASSPAGDWAIAVMALGQHYGIPTNGIDITSNLEVAVWFATHKFIKLEDGRARFRQMNKIDWPDNPELWPVVYFIQPVTDSIIPSIRKIESLRNLGLEALRPERQFAQFFWGAHSIHQNRLAEALVCMVRLKPGEYDTGLTYYHLFPPPYEDPTYKFMLDLRRRYSDGPFGPFFSEIVDYKLAE
ncbi:Tetratricopeptide (TPR) repeat, partial [Methanophagales archaeon]